MNGKRSVIALVLLAAALLCGCSNARQKAVGENTVNMAYAGAEGDTHSYTSDLGTFSYQRNGTILLEGGEFARMRGSGGTFRLDEQRSCTAALNKAGQLVTVTLPAGTVIGRADYEKIDAALLVYRAESTLASRRAVALAVALAVLLVLAALGLYAVRPVTAWIARRRALETEKVEKAVRWGRILGVVFILLAALVIIIWVI